jgi:hypothetical protein
VWDISTFTKNYIYDVMGRVVALNLNYTLIKYYEGICLYILIPYRAFMHTVYSWICIVLTLHSRSQFWHFYNGSISNYSCNWPPPWSSAQGSWLQIQKSGFDSQRYHIFWEVVGLKRGPLSLVSTFEELLERNCSRTGLGNRDYGRRRSAVLITRHPSNRKSWH